MKSKTRAWFFKKYHKTFSQINHRNRRSKLMKVKMDIKTF